MTREFTAEELINGCEYTENLYLTDEQYVVIKKIPFDVFTNVYKEFEKTKDENELNRTLISLALVRPTIEKDKILSLPIDYVTKMINGITKLCLPADETEVEKFRQDQ